MLIRRLVVLALTLLGCILGILVVREDPRAELSLSSAACFLLAYVYAEMTRPKEPYHG